MNKKIVYYLVSAASFTAAILVWFYYFLYGNAGPGNFIGLPIAFILVVLGFVYFFKASKTH